MEMFDILSELMSLVGRGGTTSKAELAERKSDRMHVLFELFLDTGPGPEGGFTSRGQGRKGGHISGEGAGEKTEDGSEMMFVPFVIFTTDKRGSVVDASRKPVRAVWQAPSTLMGTFWMADTMNSMASLMLVNRSQVLLFLPCKRFRWVSCLHSQVFCFCKAVGIANENVGNIECTRGC